MGNFDVILVNHSILQSGIDALVTEQLLYLLDRHTLVNCRGRKRSSEFMRMHFAQVKFSAQFAQTNFDATDQQPVIRML